MATDQQRELKVWHCEGCKEPLGEVGPDGRLRWYDEAVTVAAGDGQTRLIGCRKCGRVNPWRRNGKEKEE